MKQNIKRGVSLTLVFMMLLCSSTTVFANTIENRNAGKIIDSELSLKYFAFDPCTGKMMDDLQITSIRFIPNAAAISIMLFLNGNDYNFLLHETDSINGIESFQCYESFGTNSYCLCMYNEGIVSGMLRVFSDKDSFPMHSVAFIASEDQNIIDYLSDAICKRQLVDTSTIYLFHDTMQDRSSILHASLFASLGNHFAEFWTAVDFNASERVTTVTQYNINTNIIGDGCYLRKRDISTEYVYTLWATPTLPPQGLQTVSNETHFISYEYIGMMDVTVTGVVTINFPGQSIPIPIVWIYADGLEF